jgi:hypothetical protein
MSATKLALVLLASGLTGCAGQTRIAYPSRAAELYPLSQTTGHVSVAVDGVRSRARSERYFGADLPGSRILPVTVIISNYSAHSLVVTPADVLLRRDREVIDPLPAKTVAAVAGGASTLDAQPSGEAARYFEGLALKEAVLAPGQSYHGTVFFILPREPHTAERPPQLPVFLTDSRLQVVVAARDLATQTRLRFGPFALPSATDSGR